MSFSKLFTASDGKIPFLQILIGIIVGAIGMFIYVKFWKPKILFDNVESIAGAGVSQPLPAPNAKIQMQPQQQPPQQTMQQPMQQPMQQAIQSPNGNVPQGTIRMSPPMMSNGEAYIEIQHMQMPSMPPLATIYEAGEEEPEEETDDEDEEPQYNRQL